ncbi:hypothetical protein [Rheinheimera sp.]|uniref:hypothetical protein n=1 Tax=Rheinheimera sp. TaxID=1869214 RepID=UPI002736FAB5|nr:hypothetical protein [Rheinheimera sp.]MDP2714147.1 hypothetical protein [Rheinheimera sp.]
MILAKIVSLICCTFFLVASITIFIKRRCELKERLNWVADNKKFYLYLSIGLPALTVFLFMMQFQMLSEWFPSIHARKYSNEPIYQMLVVVTSKEMRGKGDYMKIINLKGSDKDFRVSDKYYKSVKVGQSVVIGYRKTRFGQQVLFYMP